VRLQEYAVGKFKTIVSRKGIKKAIKKGLVFVNSRRGFTGDWILGGETLVLYRGIQAKKPALNLVLEVLFEDDYLAIVNKPAGILVSGNRRCTIENALSFNLKMSSQEDALQWPEPIHRLDYPTTGALLVGKTLTAVVLLNKLFQNREIKKIYHAVSVGFIKPEGQIIEPIDGKKSQSEFKKIKTISSKKYECFNFLKLQPHTGRRHQLRKHLYSLGSPILGDLQYKKEGKVLKGKGLYLHASTLSFEHPILGSSIKGYASLPKKFKKLFPNEVKMIEKEIFLSDKKE